MEDEITEPTYVEIVCEARLNPTEKRETIEDIITNFLPGEPFLDERFDGDYLVVRNSNQEALQIFAEWVKTQQVGEIVRDRLFRSITGNITALYFNRQAAAMERLAIVDINDNPPNGPIILQIVSDGLEYLIDEIAPRLYRGREVTKSEWEEIKAKRLKKKENKQRDIKREKAKEQKYNY